eukprot:jgi/Orpsp1_1/1181267/evm.model.c7180000076523.1
MIINKDEIRVKLIEIIKNNNIIELEQYIRGNDIQIKTLNNGFFDILITAIENEVSIQMIEFIISNGKYRTMNFIIGGNHDFINKTPLSSAIERCNFKIANYLMEYGADINYISYDILKNIVNNKNSKYILNKGICINEVLIKHLIKDKKNFFLEQILEYHIYNNDFILKLVSFYKINASLSDNQLLEEILNEKEKFKFNESFYKIAVKNSNFDAINILYNNDFRDNCLILNELYNIFETEEKKRKIEFINKIKNKDIEIPFDEQLLIKLENITTFYEKKVIIEELIKNNNLVELQNYIKKYNIHMTDYNEKYDEYNDILKFSIENNVSIKMLNFIIQQCHYEILNFNININNEQMSLLYYLISINKFKYFEFLVKKGADVNFGKILTCLYDNKLINNKNLKYILNGNFYIPVNSINKLIIDNQFGLLKNIFRKYIYNNNFILKLLTIYKNKIPVINQELKKILSEEKNKLKFNEILYKTALDIDNFEAISFLYNNDNRNKDVVLYEIFQLLDKDERKYHNGKISLFIEKIKNGEINVQIDEKFLNNFYNIEEKRKLMIEKIKMNDVLELKNYIRKEHILITYYNNENFDILIFAIENDVSLDIIKFIIVYYSSLNFVIHDKRTCNYKSPLSCAISSNKFLIAKLLLNNGADINYKIHNSDIISKCNCEHLLNYRNLNFVLNNGYSITTELITSLIRNNKNKILKIIFNYYIYDNIFILKFLSIFKNKIKLSKKKLEDIILKEKFKINIKHEWYFEALYYNNNEALEMLISIIGDQNNLFFDKFEMYKLLDKAIYERNYSFIENIFSSKLFDSDNFNIEEYLSSTRIKYRIDIVEYFIDNILKNESFDFKNTSFENLLLNISEINNITFNFIKKFISESFNHVSFSFKFVNFEKVLLTMSKIHEINEIDTMSYFKLCYYIIDNSLNHKTFDFKFIKFENFISIVSHYHIESNDFSYFSDLIELIIKKSLEHRTFDFKNVSYEDILLTINKLHETDKINSKGFFKLKKLIIEKSLNHKTFDFEFISFENILFILSQYQYDNIDFPDFSYLTKIVIDKSIHHSTFNFKNLNIKKILLILKQLDDNIPFLEFFINELLDCQHFDMCFENVKNIILVSRKVRNIKFMEFIIEKILDCKEFNFNNINNINNIEKLLIIASKLDNINIFKYFINRILNHKTLEYNYIDIETILLASSKMDNTSYIKYIIDNTFNNRYIKESFNVKFINLEKIFLSAIYNNNSFVIKYIIETFIKNDDIKSINFEKFLLSSNKINNKNMIKLFIEKLLNQSSIESYIDIDQIDFSLIKNIDSQFLSLILNSFIKLQNFVGVKFIIENKEVKNRINLNIKDRNGDYPIFTASCIINSCKNGLEIFHYLVEHGADYNIKNDSNLSLFLLALKNCNYILLNYLFKQKIEIISNIDINNNLLFNAIYKNDVEIIKYFVNKGKINEYYDTYNYYIPLSLAYLLNYKDIFNILLNHLSINELDYYGYSILHYAILKEDIETINLLMNMGANINFKMNKYLNGHSALDISIKIGNKDIILIFLNSDNLRINDLNKNFEAPLITLYKTYNYFLEDKIILMKYFLQKDSNINICDRNGKSILLYALKNNSLELIKLLIENNKKYPINENLKILMFRYSIRSSNTDIF